LGQTVKESISYMLQLYKYCRTVLLDDIRVMDK